MSASFVSIKSGNIINDRPATEFSDEEILLGRFQRASSFEVDFRMGLSYQFGSIFNNVVNNRF